MFDPTCKSRRCARKKNKLNLHVRTHLKMHDAWDEQSNIYMDKLEIERCAISLLKNKQRRRKRRKADK
jgi:hypothetical protein